MSSSSSSNGIGLLGALTLVFVVLKLTEVGTVAHWSWFWVLSPILIPWMVVLGGLAVGFPVYAVVMWFKRRAAMTAALRGDE